MTVKEAFFPMGMRDQIKRGDMAGVAVIHGVSLGRVTDQAVRHERKVAGRGEVDLVHAAMAGHASGLGALLRGNLLAVPCEIG